MANAKTKLDPTGLSGARDITQDRLSSVVGVKVDLRSGRAIATTTTERNASSGQFVIRRSEADGASRPVQKK
jgi:hypothetical protein